MKKETRDTLITVAAVAAVFVTVYAGIVLYTGTSAPFYTVESGSMMHSERSQIGIIDTGDMVIAKDPSKTDIVTYVEGSQTGYRKFGDYGDVILYRDAGGRTIIHRAVLYIELSAGGTGWDIPSLMDYGGEWYYNGTPGGDLTAGDFEDMGGELRFADLGWAGKEVVINLDGLAPAPGGYITMGDARSNTVDQNSSVSLGRIVGDDRIVAVAAQEVPWIGCIKLYITGTNTGNIPSESVVSLILTVIVAVSLAAAATMLYDCVKHKKE